MTFRDWEKQFKKALKGLSSQEKQTALEYYRELYGDKIDAGCSPEDAVAQFGNPIDCAQNIIAENAPETQKQNGNYAPTKTKRVRKVSTHSISLTIGMVFLTLLLIIPLFSCLFSTITSFGAVAIVCAVGAVACLLLVFIYPVYLIIYGASWGGVVANLGLCLVGLGVCAILAIGLYYPTKYLAIWSIKLFKRIYFKGDRV